jgi:hypothetical protein
MRWKRAAMSVWLKLKAWPMCSEPETVSGGVSTTKVSERGRVGSQW